MFSKVEREYEGDTIIEFVGLATLKSVSRIPEDPAKQRKNSNGKAYSMCTVEVEAPNGSIMPVTLQIYQGNWEKIAEEGRDFVIGEKYLTTLRPTPDREDPNKILWFGQVSHLQNATTDHDALTAAFEFNAEPVAANA